MKEDKHLQELLNRKSSRWGNITIKEFERDITLLQNTVIELQNKLTIEQYRTKEYINKWVSSLIDHFEMMDDYMPEWRIYLKDEIKQVSDLLKTR